MILNNRGELKELGLKVDLIDNKAKNGIHNTKTRLRRSFGIDEKKSLLWKTSGFRISSKKQK